MRTLESKSKIEAAEKAYNNLTDSQKAQVTNYQTLVEAREALNELLKDVKEESVVYSGSFGTVSGVSGYASYTFSLEGKEWYASKAYMQGTEFRLGHNKAATVENKFLSPLGLSSVDGSSLEMKFDLSNASSITFKTNGQYGTVNKLYILKSLDQGNTYSKCAELTYSESTKTYEYKGEFESNVRYALVITGTKPRLILDSVEIKGII